MLQKNKPKKIAFVWWWTWGHIYPGLNVLKYIQKKNSNIKVLWIGEKDSLEQKIMEEWDIPFFHIQSGKLRRYFSLKTFLAPFKIGIGILQSLLILKREWVTTIFSKWWYVSLPVCISWWILGIPITLHESDSVAGLANRMCGKFATNIFLNFEQAEPYFDSTKIKWTQPLLPEWILQFSDVNRISVKKKNKQDRKRVLVSCGSQGSTAIFDTLVKNAPRLVEYDFSVVLGTKNVTYSWFDEIDNMHVLPFSEDQEVYIQKLLEVDMVITRGGGSILEFGALGIPMLIIPHPYTWGNHQYHNAKALDKYGHIILEQSKLSSDFVSSLEKCFDTRVSEMPVSFSVYDQILLELTK